MKKAFEDNLDSWYKRAKIISNEYSNFVENKELFLKETEEISKKKDTEVCVQDKVEDEDEELGLVQQEIVKKESLHYFHSLLDDRNNVQSELDLWNKKLKDVMTKLNNVDQKLRNMDYISYDVSKKIDENFKN